jgi:hypothetical protein
VKIQDRQAATSHSSITCCVQPLRHPYSEHNRWTLNKRTTVLIEGER